MIFCCLGLFVLGGNQRNLNRQVEMQDLDYAK